MSDETSSGTEHDERMKAGSQKTMRVSMVMDYTVEIEVPPNADLGHHADHEFHEHLRSGQRERWHADVYVDGEVDGRE